ncbi:MAG: S66 peptidase family protein [Sarcina sp.]
MLPKTLKKGDTIGIISPASGNDSETFDKYIKAFKEFGFKILEGKNMRNENGYLSASDIERSEDFNAMFQNKEVKAIICFRGGYGSMRMLEHVNLDLIKKNPKFFIGYSDITLLLNYINKKTKLITYHGPMIKSDFSDFYTKESLLNTLTNKVKNSSIDLNIFETVESFNSKKITSSIVGGNLSILCSSLGTPYEVDFSNKVLLLEEVNEAPYAIDRMLTQLKCSKKLDNCAGFLIGHLTPKNSNLEKVILDILMPLDKPILTGLPIGHSYPNLTIPLGLKCTVDFHNKKIDF